MTLDEEFKIIEEFVKDGNANFLKPKSDKYKANSKDHLKKLKEYFLNARPENKKKRKPSKTQNDEVLWEFIKSKHDLSDNQVKEYSKFHKLAMTYETMVYGGMNKLEADEHIKDIVISNERGNSQEYVMHGANLQGIVTMIKKNGEKVKKDVNNSTIKVSWIKVPDMSYSLKDIMFREDKPYDHGWACGASSGYVAIHREQPDEVYMIGHDIHSHNNKVNNLYKSTKHYVAKENGPTPGVNWIRQWMTLADWNPNVKFIKVNRFLDGRDMVNGKIEEWKDRKNIIYTDYSTLDNLA